MAILPTIPQRTLFAALLITLTGLVHAQEPKLDPVATRDYAIAVGYQRRQLYKQAIPRWQAFVKTYPKDPRLPKASHYLGVCQLQSGQFAEAAQTFTEVLKQHPKFEQRDVVQFNLALAHYNAGQASRKPEDLKKAAAEFAAVPTNYPKSKQADRARYYQGECLYSANEIAGAIQAYQQLITGYPDSTLIPDAYYAVGTAQQQIKQHAQAATTFQTFLQKYPKSELADECRLRLGQTFLDQKKYNEAVRELEQLRKKKDYAHADYALMRLAECRYLQKQLPQAAALYESLPTQFAKSKYIALAWLRAGKCWYEANQFNRALPDFKRLIDQKLPGADEAIYWMGQSLIELKQAPQASQILTQGLNQYPKSEFLPEMTYTRARSLNQQPAQKKAAVQGFLEFATKYPTHKLAAKALYSGARTAIALQDHATAQKLCTTFLQNQAYAKHELMPGVLFLAGESTLNAKEPKPVDALAHYQKLITEHAQHPQVPEANLRLGLCLYLTKKYQESLKALMLATSRLQDKSLLAESYLLLGRNQKELNQLNEAVTAFQKSLQTNPQWERNDEVLLALALTLAQQKKHAEQAKALQQLLNAHPKSTHRPQAYYQLGEIAQQQNKPEDARSHFQKLVAEYPKHNLAAPAQYGICSIWFTKKDYNQVITQVGTLFDRYGESEVALRGVLLRGLAYQRLSKYPEAIKDLEAFLEGKSGERDMLDARYALALCQLGLKQNDQAILSLEQILKDKPDYAQADQARYELAFAYLKSNKSDEAKRVFRDLAMKNPKSPLAAESWFHVGDLSEKAKQLAEAATAFEAGLKASPEKDLREKLQYKLGWTQYQQKQFDKAAVTLQEQLKTSPKGNFALDANYLAGECLYLQKKYAESLPLFQQIIDQKAQQYLARALYRSGDVQGQLRQWAESEKNYAMLLEQFPKFELKQDARYGLGWAQQNLKKWKEAEDAYRLIIKETTAEVAAKSSFMLGEIAFAQEKYEKATEHFLDTALGYPYKEWQALSYFEAGRCFLELKNTKKAREVLEELIKKHPEHPRAADAKKLLEK